MYDIVQLIDSEEKMKVTGEVLESLSEWFAIEESRKHYIAYSADQMFWCAYCGRQVAGFLYLNETGRDTVELCVMGVKKEYHRLGIGRALFEAAYDTAKKYGYSFIQVKTVQMGKYPDYDDTNRFYQSLGFKEFEVFPTLWDEANPCQIYVMSLHER